MSVKGTVTSFDERTLWGTVSYDLSSERFHSTSYSGRGWPYVGAKVEIVYNEKGQLLAVHEIDDSFQEMNEGAHKLDLPGGPECRCGQPSAHESGWCGVCEV